MSKVALIVFTEGRMREDVYQKRKAAVQKELDLLLARIKSYIDVYIVKPEEIRNKMDLKLAVADIKKQDIHGCLLYIGSFVNASDVAMAIRLLNSIPCVLIGNDSSKTMSMVGLLAAAGAATQAGLKFKRIDGDIKEDGVANKLITYFQAARAKKQLEGQTMGVIGGRALGISTAVSDPAQWLKVFGVDITHIDQMEIVTKANAISQLQVEVYRGWIEKYYGKICYKGGRFESGNLDRMIRSYLAVKELIKIHGLDFIGIKCQPELSNGYAVQCLTVQILNDPYDADGDKDPVVCSCEADADGALTMQILKHISGGKPTALQDIFSLKGNILVLANCGSSASYFSRYSESMQENLKEVYLQPHDFGEAGGAATQFNFGAGINTYARLTRDNMSYRMLITRGKVLPRTREDLYKYSWYRPTSVVEIEAKEEELRGNMNSNHLLCVEGDYVDALAEFCKLCDITYHILV